MWLIDIDRCGPTGLAASAMRPHVAEGREGERSETVVPRLVCLITFFCHMVSGANQRSLFFNTRTQKILSNVPQDIECSAPQRRKIHDNSMYYFACRCTNEIIYANSMFFFKIASKSMRIEELVAVSPPPTLLCEQFFMRFRINTCYWKV